MEKFSLEIETYYTPDGGHLENVFKLPVSFNQENFSSQQAEPTGKCNCFFNTATWNLPVRSVEPTEPTLSETPLYGGGGAAPSEALLMQSQRGIRLRLF